MTDNFRYIIFCAGAVGSTIGGFLKLAGKDTILIGRKKHTDAVWEHGLQMNSYTESWSVDIPAFDSIEKIHPRKNDII